VYIQSELGWKKPYLMLSVVHLFLPDQFYIREFPFSALLLPTTALANISPNLREW